MGDKPPAVYDLEDAALNARIAQKDDGYDGKYGNLIGYWFEMILPGRSVPFLGKARVEPIVSRLVWEELEAKGIKPHTISGSDRHKMAIELVAKNGFLFECREFSGNWKNFTLDDLCLIRNGFVTLYFMRDRAGDEGKTRYTPVPEVNGVALKKIVFNLLGWPKEVQSTISTVEV